MVPLGEPDEILYRQNIIKDFYRQEELLGSLYECAVRQQKALRIFKEAEEKNRSKSTKKAGEILDTLEYLKQGQEDLLLIRDLLAENRESLHSEGLLSLLGRLKIDHAVVNYCESTKRPRKRAKQGGLQKFYYNFVKRNAIPMHGNEALQQDVNHLKEFTMQQVLKIFESYLHKMMKFFEHFSEEMAFYQGVVNFMVRMKELNIILSMPVPLQIGTKDTKFQELYELSMAIYLQSKPVGNTLDLMDNRLTLVTGANQGGKSTFLRSYGIAQVLMQCGMPVPAREFTAPIYRQIFTHFTRREDEQLNSGRLREELQRMSDMIKAAGPGCVFLLNESFASTTEREGSKIAEGILKAFYEKEITTIMVTHLFQLAKTLYEKKLDGTYFLVAERKPDGARTYRMLPGEPGYTSYGTDLFEILESELGK